ncbi:MAG: PleD family two-component system response regulator [Terriglobia bacterium]
MARTVLVADDSPTHQRRASGILTGEGLEVVTVSNGVAAIKKLAALKPSLILADVSMPGRDGYEVCEHVKNSPDLVKVPVLLIFSDQEPFDEGRAQRARADGRIKKPFAQDDLVAAVTRYLLPEEVAPPPPPIPPPAEPSVVTEPVDLEPDLSTKPASPELSALPEGMAFGAGSLDEIAPPAEPPAPFPEPLTFAPQPSMDLPPSLEEALTAPAEARTEERPVPEEFVPPTPAPPEAPRDEPMLVEEAESVPEPEPERPAERTMMFRMPVQLAQPILADDLAPAPAAETAPPPPAEDQAAPPVSATTLESYSLTDATSGHVRFAEPETVISTTDKLHPAEAPAEAVPAEATAAPVQALDVELINWIVHSVVIRMAPPALRTETLDEVVKQLSDEIITALTQPPEA